MEKAMTRKLTALAAATTLGTLGLTAAVLADENNPAPTDMMGNHGGMMGMMSQMNPGQMVRMVESCNRMMASLRIEGGDMQHSSTPPK
jgi:hypothetical protein